MAEQVLVKATSKKAMKSYSSKILVVCTRELLGYMVNDGTIFHYADSVSIITIYCCFLSQE